MFNSIQFDLKGYAWGRNGRFVPAKAEALRFSTGELEVTVESRKNGDRSPIVIRLSGRDSVRFAKMILKASRKGEG